MFRPTAPPPPAPVPSRRSLLRAVGAAALLPLTGCGSLALGGPEAYTPPPPGIDDLYRVDLLALLERAIVGADRVRADGAAADDPELSTALDALDAALPVQHRALLTGAEKEKAQETADPSPGRTPPAPPADSPTDLPGLVSTLVELRDLTASAARQVSGSLARPTLGIGAHTAWIVQRLSGGAGDQGISPLPTVEQLVPAREAPDSDPASIGAEEDYHRAIERAQLEEWYAGYLHEVLAARSEDPERAAHLDRSALHRERATVLAGIAEEDGAPMVERKAVYAIPGGMLDEESAAQLPTLLAQGLLLDHIALVGAAPFERRPLSIVAALQEAETLAPLVGSMEPLPGLEVEETPPAAG